MIRRIGAQAPSAGQIGYDVIGAQPGTFRSPSKRCLIDGGCKSAGRRSGQYPGISRPADIEILPGWSSRVHDFEMLPKPRERPIQGARQPRHSILISRKGSAPPLVGAIEEPDPGKPKGGSNGLKFRNV